MMDNGLLGIAAARLAKQTALMEKEEEYTLVAKYGKEKITLSDLHVTTTILSVKTILAEKTGILPKRQKLVGLKCLSSNMTLMDDHTLAEVKFNAKKQFILMGTREEAIFVDPSKKDDLPDVVDDFDLEWVAGSDEWVKHVANGKLLQEFTESTQIHIMNEPRKGKPLLVLDLDHTLLDFSSKHLARADSYQVGDRSAAVLKRPYMDQFLTAVYPHYDLVVWSQTSWRWLETKLTELGMITHSGYRFSFVLDKTSMFTVTSKKRDGTSFKHHVKPLQIIWSKFPCWNSHNTVHVDDLRRNFALNLGSGLLVSAYYRKKRKASTDSELLGLSIFLERLAQAQTDFNNVDFRYWLDVVSGKRKLVRENSEEDTKKSSKA